MKCARITIIMKMGPAAAVTITINTVTHADMSTAMSRNTSTPMAKRILMKGMNTITAVVKNMGTIITAAVMNSIITNMVMMNVAVGMNTTTNISMAKAAVVGNITTMSMKKAAPADMNIITATMFRVTRRTVSAKSAIRMKNTVTCAAKALKTAPAVCRMLTA